MRIDPKYFPLFLSACAALTVVVILYGTISYQKKQAETFRENLSAVDFQELGFQTMTGRDSLMVSSFLGRPVVIDFWSSWSGRSRNVHKLLIEISENHPELAILSAVVKDGKDEAEAYIDSDEFPFHFVQGTSLYNDLQVPGIPSQIFIDRSGRLVDIQIGEDSVRTRQIIERLMPDE
ncbi:MAG: TlpA disulfide reductase family protein [Balneolaceae bacterium]